MFGLGMQEIVVLLIVIGIVTLVVFFVSRGNKK